MLYPEDAEDGRIHETAYAQPALFAVEYALWELWRTFGVEPDVMMVVAAMHKSLVVATRDSALRDKLWENVRHLRKNLEALNLDLGESASQIIPVIIGSNGEQLISMALAALKRGLFLQPIDLALLTL